jgi:hypothetical protein
VRQASTKAVASFRASPPISAPPFIRGLCHMSAARSEILLSACHEGDIAIIKLEIGKLCGVLRDLRQAIDEALRRVSTEVDPVTRTALGGFLVGSRAVPLL